MIRKYENVGGHGGGECDLCDAMRFFSKRQQLMSIGVQEGGVEEEEERAASHHPMMMYMYIHTFKPQSSIISVKERTPLRAPAHLSSCYCLY